MARCHGERLVGRRLGGAGIGWLAVHKLSAGTCRGVWSGVTNMSSVWCIQEQARAGATPQTRARVVASESEPQAQVPRRACSRSGQRQHIAAGHAPSTRPRPGSFGVDQAPRPSVSEAARAALPFLDLRSLGGGLSGLCVTAHTLNRACPANGVRPIRKLPLGPTAVKPPTPLPLSPTPTLS